MRIEYSVSGEPRPIFEIGDLVRLRRNEAGPIVTAREGEWGRVVRVGPRGIDVLFAGYCRPSRADVPTASSLPPWLLAPCDAQGLLVELQRDLDRRR